MKDRLVAKRFVNIILMLAVTLFADSLMAALHGRYLDEIVLLVVTDLVFFVLFLYVLEYHRLQKNIAGNRETSFRRILKGYLLSWCVVFGASFLPEFLKPILLIPILMTAYGTSEIAVYAGIFLNLSMCLALGSSIQECVMYAFLTLFGCMMAEGMEQGRVKSFWYGLLVLGISVLMPGCFYYLAYREVRMKLFLFGGVEGVLIAGVLLLFFKRITLEKQDEVIDTLDDILDENYPLHRELRSFSKADYRHAKRVSKVAASCAKLVGADERICAAAGFYYRIGILEGEAIGKNGVRIAQRECFPEVIIRIISEYNGEEALPSDIESAIVHMVDGLIKKIEVLDSTTMSSEWNQDMVIYQTLNDFSAKGLYDQSGLSMNMFLKIREYLVNKEALV